MKAPTHVALQAPSEKIKQDYIGPLVIGTVLDRTHFILQDVDGKIIPWLVGSVFIEDLKPYHINLGGVEKGQLTTTNTIGGLKLATKQLCQDFKPP